MSATVDAVAEGRQVPRRGEWIRNPVTRERLRFTVHADETGGERCVLDFVCEARGGGVPEVHLHEGQTEIFRVRAGALHLWVDGVERVLRPGEELAVPPNVPHGLVNRGDVDAVLEVEYRPALRSEWWLSTFHAAAERAGESPALVDFLPHLVAKRVGLRPTHVPRPLVLLLGWLLVPWSRLSGRWRRMPALAVGGDHQSVSA